MEHQTRSSQISLGPTVQQQENWAVRKSRLLSDGQTTELRIHTYPFDDEKGPCFDLDECTVYRSSPQSMPRFTIYSTRKGHSQNAVLSSYTVTQLSPSGVPKWPHRNSHRLSTDAWARLSDSTLLTLGTLCATTMIISLAEPSGQKVVRWEGSSDDSRVAPRRLWARLRLNAIQLFWWSIMFSGVRSY